MPIHVQTLEGKVLTWAEKEEIKLRKEIVEAPEKHYLATHHVLMRHFKIPSFHNTITRDWMDKINDGIFF